MHAENKSQNGYYSNVEIRIQNNKAHHKNKQAYSMLHYMCSIYFTKDVGSMTVFKSKQDFIDLSQHSFHRKSIIAKLYCLGIVNFEYIANSS